jgi:hypothetical protein
LKNNKIDVDKLAAFCINCADGLTGQALPAARPAGFTSRNQRQQPQEAIL